jgi:hypothetical protein
MTRREPVRAKSVRVMLLLTILRGALCGAVIFAAILLAQQLLRRP